MFQLELRIPPLVLVAVFAVGIALVTVYVPLFVVPLPGHKYAAEALVLAGLLLALAGVVVTPCTGKADPRGCPSRTRSAGGSAPSGLKH